MTALAGVPDIITGSQPTLSALLTWTREYRRGDRLGIGTVPLSYDWGAGAWRTSDGAVYDMPAARFGQSDPAPPNVRILFTIGEGSAKQGASLTLTPIENSAGVLDITKPLNVAQWVTGAAYESLQTQQQNAIAALNEFSTQGAAVAQSIADGLGLLDGVLADIEQSAVQAAALFGATPAANQAAIPATAGLYFPTDAASGGMIYQREAGGALTPRPDLQATSRASISNVLPSSLAAKSQAMGPQFADGSRWLWNATGPANGGTVVAASGGGFWKRDFSGAIDVNWFRETATPIMSAVNAAGSTGAIIIPGNVTSNEELLNNFNIPVTDYRHQQFGIHSVIAPQFPTNYYPFGHDLVLRAQGSADTYIEHLHVTTQTTSNLVVGWNYNVPIASVIRGSQARGAVQTGDAYLFSEWGTIVVGRETANEEQVNRPNFSVVDATHLNILCVNPHTGPMDVEQIGSTLLSSQDLYITSNHVKPALNTAWDAPMRMKDLGGRIIAYLPTNINNIAPYGMFRFGAVIGGAQGGNSNLLFQNTLAISKTIWRDNTGATIASLNNSGAFTVAAGISTGPGALNVAGGAAELQVGRTAAAVTSATDAVVAWQDSTQPLNSTVTGGSLLLAARNVAGTAVHIATQNINRVIVSSTGLRVIGGITAGGAAVTNGSAGAVQSGRTSAAITSTVDAFVAWQETTDPLNTTATGGSLLLAGRNTAGATVNIAAEGANKLVVRGGYVQLTVPLKHNVYTKATLPSASASGNSATTSVSDFTAGKTPFVYSDGTVWRYALDASAV